jgi:GNAT superfamily N-acetyltransferase
VVWDPTETAIVADAGAAFWDTDENRHILDFGIGVLPAYRRQGIARRLLALGADFAEEQGRRLMLCESNDRMPAGEAFLLRLGAERRLETHLNQLALDELDQALVERWLQEGPERAPGFALGFWEGLYPEAELEAIAELHNVMNTAPRGTLDLEDFTTTVAMLRDRERSLVADGDKRITAFVRERATGAFAGFTELFWHPNRPYLAWQGATGVYPQFRNHGLGRWLKAANLTRLMREHPELRSVRTGNADSNAPMLKINHALGFKPLIAYGYWQIDVARVRAYLATSICQ